MKVIAALQINLKKLRKRTGKAAFLIIPILILVALAMTISSQVLNIQTALAESVFGQIQEENTLLILKYPADQNMFGAGPGAGRMAPTEMQYTEVDLSTIEAINHVEDAVITYTVPVSNAKTTDLFENTTLGLSDISVLNENIAGQYTSESFTYSENATIPIILNASQFIESYEDWGGQTEIIIDFRSMRPEPGAIGQPPEQGGTDELQASSPQKTRAIEYSKEDLIGKTFTLTFGGFSDISDIETTMDAGAITLTQLTDEKVAALETERTDAINEYWDYSTLSQGISYTFKVAGVIESETDRAVYIPEGFASTLMNDYISLQLNSLTDTSISTNLLNSTFTGMTYNGTELSSGSSSFGPGGGGGMMGSDRDTSSYEIPGLVIETDENDTSDITGIYDDPTVFESAIKQGDTIYIKIDSVLNRNEVIDTLNNKGYALQDTSKLEVFNKVQNTLNTISSGVIIAFIALTAAVIILTMSKFVSESTKEIGIYRAIGFTKGNILALFLAQSLLYTFVGYALGLAAGFLLNLAVSPLVRVWFEGFAVGTVAKAFGSVNAVDSSVFTAIDLNATAIISVILVVITLIISFMPAYKASVISPVEAIKSE